MKGPTELDEAAVVQSGGAHDSKLTLFIAGCLSSAIPGLGHFFRKLNKRGLLWVTSFGAALTTTFVLQPWHSANGLITAFYAGAALLTASAVDAAFAQTEAGSRVTRWAVLLFACIAFIASVFANSSVWRVTGFKTFSIPSTGMEPTIHRNEGVVANMHAYRGVSPHRGDVVIFDNPEDRGHPFLKRVIAIPGDTIQGHDGKITLNGVPMAESYVIQGSEVPKDLSNSSSNGLVSKTYNFGPVTLAPQEYFVMGDNRPRSYDSRHKGPVKLDAIRGQALYIFDKKHPTRDGKRLD